MKKIYLCGHTGSINRGCEAIISSSADVLKMCGVKEIDVFTFKKQDDIKFGLNERVNLVSYPQKSFFAKAMTYARRRFFGDAKWGAKYLYRKLLQNIDKENSVLFNVGGDTYCYNTPIISYALNDVAKEMGVPNIFWGCSIETSTLEKPEMIADLNKYSGIVVRERLSQQIFEQCMEDKGKIYKTCDPAFHLAIKETELPEHFIEGNTLGLNVSPLVFSDADDKDDIMYKNVYALIDYVLENTDMNICLIPHVYNYETNLEDSRILPVIYDRYKDTGRVGIVMDELSCTQLKYIISKCRFFIGARTHSTIAAYSTAVPCIAISYSIKSRGIATDLFGTDEGYALPYKNISGENELRDAFIKVLFEKEEEIRKTYESVLPAYKQSIIDATKEILSKV